MDPIGRLARSVEPDLRLEVGQRVGIERLGRVDPLVGLEDRDLVGRRFDLEPTQPRRDADDRGDPVGVLDGRIERDRPAARVADQRRPPDAERIENGDTSASERELDILGGRGAVAAGVEANDAVAGRVERRDHRVPGPQVGDAGVQEDERRPLTLIDDEEAAARDIDMSISQSCHPSRAIGSRSIVRTWRVRPASVRTSAAGMTPDVSFSITAASPAYSPPPAILTRSPTDSPALPLPALRSIVATVGRTYGASGPAPARGAGLVSVRAGG